MERPPNPHTPESWDAASEGYDQQIAPFTGRYADALIERLEVHPDARVLEVAAGTGALTVQLAPKVRAVLATDFSPRMMERLRARVASLGIDNVECAIMDGQALDVADGDFDRAVCNFGVMLFPDRPRAFAELRRALRSDGRAVVSGWAGPERFEMFGAFLGAVRVALPDFNPPTPPPVFSLADPDRFKAEMEGAGFREVRVHFVERELEAQTVDELWETLTAGAPPIQALFDRIGPQGAVKVREALARNLAERFGDGPIRFRNVATVGVGIA